MVGFDHAGRLARASEETGRAGLDALVISPGPDLVYLAGYDPPPLERLTALVIRPGRDPVLVVPELERPRAASSPAGDLVQIAGWRDGADPYAVVVSTLSGIGRFGVSDRLWAVHVIALQAALPGLELLRGSRVLSRLRSRKDPAEIRLLARAAGAADEAFSRTIRDPFTGRTEADVARSLAGHLLDAGHESVAFTIVATGPDGASPHHEPGERAIQPGHSVVMDFGGRIGGYCSDITRTVTVGEPSGEVREVHQIVWQAQEAAFRSVGPGVRAEDVDAAARRVITEAGYGDAFIHRTGHGIGLEEHEAPYLVQGNAEALAAGMCFSIEPGIYLPGRFGVRIEDILAITEDGVVRLNQAPRELAMVG